MEKMEYNTLYFDIYDDGYKFDITVLEDDDLCKIDLEKSKYSIHPEITELLTHHSPESISDFLISLKKQSECLAYIMLPKELNYYGTSSINEIFTPATCDSINTLLDSLRKKTKQYVAEYQKGLQKGIEYQNSGYGPTFLSQWWNLDRTFRRRRNQTSQKSTI